MTRRYLLLTTLIAFVIFSFCGCGGEAKKEKAPKGSAENPIVMGFNPAESAENILINGDALAKGLEERTGLKFKTYVAQSYNTLVTALQFDDIDFAWLPVFAFVQAEKHAGAEVLLKAVRKGEPYYYSAIVVRSDSPYQKIEDLKGATMAWVSESSASGYIFPLASLMKLGIDPETFFSHSVMAGKHDSALIALANGTVDAAATFASDNKGLEGSWTQLLKEEDKGKIRPIFFSEPIPADTMSTSVRFHEKYPELVEKVVNAVKGLADDPEGQKLLIDLYNIEKMIDATSEDYEPVREAAKLLNINIEGKRQAPETAEAKEEEKTEAEQASDEKSEEEPKTDEQSGE